MCAARAWSAGSVAASVARSAAASATVRSTAATRSAAVSPADVQHAIADARPPPPPRWPCARTRWARPARGPRSRTPAGGSARRGRGRPRRRAHAGPRRPGPDRTAPGAPSAGRGASSRSRYATSLPAPYRCGSTTKHASCVSARWTHRRRAARRRTHRRHRRRPTPRPRSGPRPRRARRRGRAAARAPSSALSVVTSIGGRRADQAGEVLGRHLLAHAERRREAAEQLAARDVPDPTPVRPGRGREEERGRAVHDAEPRVPPVQRLVVPVEVAEVRAAGCAHDEIGVRVRGREARGVGVERPTAARGAAGARRS